VKTCWRAWFPGFITAVLASLLVACGGGGSTSSTQMPVTPTPTPTVTSVSPDHVAAGSSDTALTVTGNGFASGSTVMFNGTAKTTTFVSATQLTAVLRAADLTQQGVFNVTVNTPGAPAASAPMQFRVGNGLPVITSLSPSSTPAAPALPIIVTVNGSNFFPDSTVLVDFAQRATTFVSSSVLKFSLAPGELGLGRQITINVLNSGGGGGQSGPQAFTVTNPVPVAISMTPDSILAGQARLAVTITGSNFVPNATFVTVNGQTVDFDSFVSDSSHIVARFGASVAADPALLPTLLPGTAQIGVFTKGPGGGTATNTFTFTVNALPPGFNFVNVALDSAGKPIFVNTIPPNDSFDLQVATPSLSADGRYIATSYAPPFRAQPTDPGVDFLLTVRDLCNGVPTCTPNTFDANLGSEPSISTSGRYLASTKTASAHFPQPGDPPCTLSSIQCHFVQVRDTCVGGPVGCVPTNVIVSVSDVGTTEQANHPTMTPDGRFVSFVASSDLIPDGLTGSDLFLRDTCIGVAASCTPTNTRVSVGDAGAHGVDTQTGGPMTPSARFVGFSSNTRDLVAGVIPVGGVGAYLGDTCVGAPAGCTPSTKFVGIRPDGTNYDRSRSVALDDSGRLVLFTFEDLDPSNPAAATAISLAVRDTCMGAPAGCVPSTTVLTNGNVSRVSASSDLRFVAFTAPDGFVANDNNGIDDVFLLDTCIGAPAGCSQQTVRLTVTADGIQAGGGPVSISRDGKHIAFETFQRSGWIDPPIVTVMNNPLLP
jgi:trimeric autotransporter adhesin